MQHAVIINYWSAGTPGTGGTPILVDEGRAREGIKLAIMPTPTKGYGEYVSMNLKPNPLTLLGVADDHCLHATCAECVAR
jgi:hypothetical protein